MYSAGRGMTAAVSRPPGLAPRERQEGEGETWHATSLRHDFGNSSGAPVGNDSCGLFICCGRNGLGVQAFVVAAWIAPSFLARYAVSTPRSAVSTISHARILATNTPGQGSIT